MASNIGKVKKEVDAFLDGTYNNKISIITPTLLTKIEILKNKPSHIDDEVWIQNSLWIINSIIQLSNDKRFDFHKHENYIPLYSKILKQNCGNNYSIYLNGLIDNGIIECDDKYSQISHESFGFRLSDKYAISPLKYITLTDKFLVKRIKAYRKQRIQKLKKKAAPIAHLLRWLTYEGLEIDQVSALDFLETYKRKLTSELKKREIKKKYRFKQEAFVNKRYYRIKNQIETWGSNKYISIDDAGGRLYSPITGLPSIFRNFLKYKGEDLVGFDIKNSQPLHFLIMLNKNFWNKYTPGITLKRLDSSLYDSLSKKVDYPSTIMFHESSKTQSGRWFTNYTFKELVEKGKLYEFICHKFYSRHHTEGQMDRFTTRANSKREFMHMMYHNPKVRYSGAKQVFKDFQKLYPLEGRIMNFLKKRKYNDFPILLQKIEAQILLHKVAKKVFDLNPDIPLFTIHDSILTTTAHEKTLSSILEDEYKKHLHFVPQFEKTYYSEHNAWVEIKKYIESKVDQCNLELSKGGNIVLPEKYMFLNCEHYRFELKDEEKIISPDFAEYNTVPSISNIVRRKK
jgi:hypothetical protein